MERIQERDLSIDVLRCIGLIAIFIAHTFTSTMALQSVCFDVTLLMLLSGSSFALTTKKNNQIKWGQYFQRRFVRLVIPTWIFLAVYFSICYILHKNVSIWHPIYSFTLCTEWYVWIIRVFLFIALLSPLILSFDKRVKDNHVFMLLALLFFVMFDILTKNALTVFPTFEFVNQHLSQYMLYMLLICLPYVAVFAIGQRLFEMSKIQILEWAMLMLSMFFVMSLFLYDKEERFIRSDDYKYPPHLYYVTFTLAISLLFWICRYRITNALKISGLVNVVVFVGQNTIWIYLWHVLILSMTKNGLSECVRFLAVLMGGVFLYYIQYLVINRVVLPHIHSADTKKNIKRIFCG